MFGRMGAMFGRLGHIGKEQAPHSGSNILTEDSYNILLENGADAILTES